VPDRHAPCPFISHHLRHRFALDRQGVETARFQQRRIASKLANQRLDARMLKHHPGQHRIPHGHDRIVVASLAAHRLQVLHQLLIWEKIPHQVEAIQVAAGFDIPPGKQILFNGRHGVLLQRIVSITI
jgi:hypothetical protein